MFHRSRFSGAVHPRDRRPTAHSDDISTLGNDAIMKVARHVVFKMGYRYMKGKKAIDTNKIISDFAIEGIYAFFVEDMLIVQVGEYFASDIMKIALRILGKSLLEAVVLRFVMGDKRSYKMILGDLAMENGVVELVDKAYQMITKNMNVSEKGKTNIHLF